MMPAITSEWMPAELDEPAAYSAEASRKYCREEEFRLALDSYLAVYCDYQKRRTETFGITIEARKLFSRFVERLRLGDRGLARTRKPTCNARRGRRVSADAMKVTVIDATASVSSRSCANSRAFSQLPNQNSDDKPLSAPPLGAHGSQILAMYEG